MRNTTQLMPTAPTFATRVAGSLIAGLAGGVFTYYAASHSLVGAILIAILGGACYWSKQAATAQAVAYAGLFAVLNVVTVHTLLAGPFFIAGLVGAYWYGTGANRLSNAFLSWRRVVLLALAGIIADIIPFLFVPFIAFICALIAFYFGAHATESRRA